MEQGETIQWPQDTKRPIRSCKLNKDRQYNGHKIPKDQSEAVNWTRRDNTMAKRKRKKRHWSTPHKKLKIEQH